jgi:tetratricopeptide (TPR) repeat protein
MSRLEQIRKMLVSEPRDVFLNFGLAMEYVKLGQLDEAIRQFKYVNEIDPDYVPAYFQQGNALVTQGKLHEASAVLRQGIEVAERLGDHHAAAEMGEVLATFG